VVLVAFLLLCAHRNRPSAPCIKDSALRPVGLLWPLLTSSLSVPAHYCAGSPLRADRKRRSIEVRHAFFSRTRRIYPCGFRMTSGLSRPWRGHPNHTGLISAAAAKSTTVSCTSIPGFRHWLSSDPASRRAPLLSRMVPVITVQRGLPPPECTSLLDTPGETAAPPKLDGRGENDLNRPQLARAGESLREALEVKIDDRRDVERQELRHHQSADHG